MDYSLFKSRTFYTVVAMFVVGGGNAIVPVIPVQYQAVLMLILGCVASYFHLQMAQKAGAVN